MKKVLKKLLKNPVSYSEMSFLKKEKIKNVISALSNEDLKELLDNVRDDDLFFLVVRLYARRFSKNEFQVNLIIEKLTYERVVKYMASQNFNPYKKVRRMGDEDDKYKRK